MKIITPEEADAHQRATITGGAKGLFGSLALALPAAYVASRRNAYYRSLTPALKALSIVTVVVPTCVIAAERAGLEFEKAQWTGAGKEELDAVERRELERWEAMSTKEKVLDTAARHEYGIVGGAWATTMVGSFGWIMRDRTQTFAQKIVQARMWAQGLTIGVLLTAGALAHANRAKMNEANKRAVDHSWRDIIEYEQVQKKEA